MKKFFKLLLEVLFPEPKRNNCPHCGGGKCFGMCGAAGDKARPSPRGGAEARKAEAAGCEEMGKEK